MSIFDTMDCSELAGEYYDPDDVLPKSPALSPVIVDPSPNLIPSPVGLWPDSVLDHLPFSWTDATELHRRDEAQFHGLDGLLLTHMSPDHPEVALMARSLGSLNPDRQSENFISLENILRDPGIAEHSPNLRELVIPLPRSSPGQRLPALQTPYSPLADESAGSQNQERLLPSFRHLSELAGTAMSEQEPTMANGYARRHSKAKSRWGLPLTLNTSNGPATVMACADTGSEENIISSDLATALGLQVTETEAKKQFILASGKTVEAVGEISIPCSFGVETSTISASIQCIFHVFLKLVSPMIMGMAFLEETDTMTTHRERLVKIPRPSLQALHVYSLGRPRKELLCFVDKQVALATPDSGSDLDLMAPQFALERGFKVFDAEELIEFADGSVAVTSGFVQVELAVNNSESSLLTSSVTNIPAAEFFLLENLAHDVLVGQDSMEELEIFTKNQHTLVAATDAVGPMGLNIIRLMGRLDRCVSWVRSKISSSRKPDVLAGQSDSLDDQRENDRREREIARIARLPLDHRESAIKAEVEKQADYEVRFKCEHPGCTAPPFQTQYLLNSHANMHVQCGPRFRPRYCPVPGCPRGAGGRGFKRKNEMIRHGLIHASPGYICPFCPDREHKYPRPDNLQRHVRVYHADKDKDDPKLRAVLTQRPKYDPRDAKPQP